MDNRQQVSQYITEKLQNSRGAAEGSLLPPPLRGAGRIPTVTGLKVATVQSYLGGTTYTLVFKEPTLNTVEISGYNVYVTNALAGNASPLLLNTVQHSPATVRVVGTQASVLTFYVQTVLSSGNVSTLDHSPTCTAQLAAPVISTSSAVAIASINPGAANQIYGTDPTATVSEYKSLSTAANAPVSLTFGAGSIQFGAPTQAGFNAFAGAIHTYTSGASTIAAGIATAFADATSGNVTLTAPPSPISGQYLTVKRTDSSANTVSLAGNSGQTVETATWAAKGSNVFQWDSGASVWRIIAKF